MKTTALLNTLEKLIKAEGMDAAIEDETDEHPFQSLLIYLGNDEQERERVLHVKAEEQHLPEKKEAHLHTLQFSIKLPFSINEAADLEVISSVSFVNSLMEMPGFQAFPEDGSLFYRYSWIGPGATIADRELFLGIVGNMLMMVDLISPSLESVAKEKMTFQDLIKKLAKDKPS